MESMVKQQYHIAVIGRGPLGLSLAMLLNQANCKVTNYFGDGMAHQSTAINNLSIAISGMRFFQSYRSAGELQEQIDAFEDAKIGFEQQLAFQPRHQSRILSDGFAMNHGIFAMSKERFGAFRKKLATPELQEFASDYGDFSSHQARRLLGNLHLQDRLFVTSPEIPFSQEQHLRVLERRCLGVEEIPVRDHAALCVVPDDTRKARVQIYLDQVPAEDDYDFVFIAAGRYLPHFIDQLGWSDHIASRVWKFHNAKLPDHPDFGASVYYDFESHLSMVRHQMMDHEGHCLLANLGEDFQVVPPEDLLDGKPLSGIANADEKDAYLAKLRRYVDLRSADVPAIKVSNCYLIDFSLKKQASDAIRPSSKPFIFRDQGNFPQVVLGSCFRSVLSLHTAEKMIQASGLRIRWGGNVSPQATFPQKIDSRRPPHIIEAQ